MNYLPEALKRMQKQVVLISKIKHVARMCPGKFPTCISYRIIHL